MPSRLDHAVVEALRLHQPAGVRADDLVELRSRRERKVAAIRMRKAWGPNAALALEALQEAQLELGRLLATGSGESS